MSLSAEGPSLSISLRASRPRQGSCPWSSICSRGCSGGQCSRAGPPTTWRAPGKRDQSYERGKTCVRHH